MKSLTRFRGDSWRSVLTLVVGLPLAAFGGTAVAILQVHGRDILRMIFG